MQQLVARPRHRRAATRVGPRCEHCVPVLVEFVAVSARPDQTYIERGEQEKSGEYGNKAQVTSAQHLFSLPGTA